MSKLDISWPVVWVSVILSFALVVCVTAGWVWPAVAVVAMELTLGVLYALRRGREARK
jgi:hypothetical protein